MKSAWFILSALIAGMLLGIGVEMASPAAGTASLPYIEPIGLLWLNALKMTIVPLVVALLITGITATADAARAGKLAFRAVMIFLGAITLSGLMSLLMTPLLLRVFPLSAGAAEALRHGLGGTTDAAPSPTFGDFLLSLVPTNPIAAAAETAILPLIEAAMRRIRKTGKAPGYLSPVEADAKRMLAAGALFCAVGADVGILARGAEALRAKFDS